jgi:hypothetical protein
MLEQAGTADAVAALGRLADKDESARAALDRRADTDINVFIAAWAAVLRNAPWGADFLRKGLADPARASLAAQAFPRRDTRVAPFTNDLDQAVVRLSSSLQGAVVASVLASIGPAAHASVEKRLIDPKTRGVMCEGIASPDASGDAKSTLLAVPVEARDNQACVNAVSSLAKTDDVVLGWVATGAEPGLLTVAGKGDLPCPRLAEAWRRALTERPHETFPALSVPLSFALSRCSRDLDPVLAGLINQAPASRACIVQAIDPYGAGSSDLKETCKVLPLAVRTGDGRTHDRANEILSHACKNIQN